MQLSGAGAEVPTTVPSKSPTPGKMRRIWTPRRDAATASLYVESASWSSVISGADGRAGRERLRLSRGGGTADRPRGWLESSRKDDEKGAGALWRMRLGYRWGGSSAISLARRGWPPRRDGKTHIPPGYWPVPVPVTHPGYTLSDHGKKRIDPRS